MNTCPACGNPAAKKFCSHACYTKSIVGRQHSPETKAKMRAARLANNPMKGQKHTETTRAKMRAAFNKSHARGTDAVNWKGGRTIDSRGYVLVYAPDHPHATRCYVVEHRLVMEKHLGRFLSTDEVVHHKNETRDDNRIENLELTTASEHARLHRLLEVSEGTWHRGRRGQGNTKS